jgi:hypothetical protein
MGLSYHDSKIVCSGCFWEKPNKFAQEPSRDDTHDKKQGPPAFHAALNAYTNKRKTHSYFENFLETAGDTLPHKKTAPQGAKQYGGGINNGT